MKNKYHNIHNYNIYRKKKHMHNKLLAAIIEMLILSIVVK